MFLYFRYTESILPQLSSPLLITIILRLAAVVKTYYNAGRIYLQCRLLLFVNIYSILLEGSMSVTKIKSLREMCAIQMKGSITLTVFEPLLHDAISVILYTR